MGKKSKAKTTKNKAKNTQQPISLGVPVTVKNPDGSEALMQPDEHVWIGGRIVYLWNSFCDSLSDVEITKRQRETVRAMADAFHRQFDEDDSVDPMTRAVLSLEVDLTFRMESTQFNKMGGRVKVSRNEFNDSVLMSTHRWFVTTLPSRIVQQASEVAMLYRETFRSYETLVKVPLPSPNHHFQRIKGVTDQNHNDVVLLMNGLLEMPFGVNAFIFAETDNEIHLFTKEFVRSPEGLINLPPDASSSDILDYLHDQAGMLDGACCFWCEKNKLSAKLFLCTRCKVVSYCGRECQSRDWKAHHKEECEKIVGGMSRKQLHMECSRLATLMKPGRRYSRMPMQIAHRDENDNPFRGEALVGYVMHTDPETMTMTDKSRMFPYGVQILKI